MQTAKEEYKKMMLEKVQNMNDNPNFVMKKISYPSNKKLTSRTFPGLFKK